MTDKEAIKIIENIRFIRCQPGAGGEGRDKEFEALQHALSALETQSKLKEKLEGLGNALYEWKERYLLCWAGEKIDDPYDCACCIDMKSDERCGCPCHRREKDLTQIIKNYLTE